MTPVIEIKNIGKKYNITHMRGGYVSLRDVIMNIVKKPFYFLKTKAEQLAGLEKKEEFWALKNIDLKINKGDVVGIIGANGAGKSTLLKILSQITPPTEGEIKIHGRVGSLLEVGTGFHPELTGRENIFLNGAIMGMTKKEIIKKFDEIVEFAGIEKFLDTPVKHYSSGMYVRLAFSVAAHMEPDILVIDEVLAVGDADFQKKCLGKMGEITKKEGRTIIFVSHNMRAISQMCSKVTLLEGGKIVQSGENIEEIIKKYLSKQTTDGMTGLWQNEDNRFNSEYIKPLKLSITDESGNDCSMPISKNLPVFLSMDIEVKKTDFTLNIAYALYDEQHNLLYWSRSTDKYQKKWLEIKEGFVNLKAEIPTNVLNDGNYRIELMSSLHNRMWIHKPGNGPSITFAIKKMSNDPDKIIMDRPGILAPDLSWAIK